MPGGACARPNDLGPQAVKSFFVQKSSGRPLDVYEPEQKLGEGSFGVAHLVRDRRTGQQRVLKTINKRQSQVPPAQMEQEIRNLKACDHPHIIRLFEYYEDYENVYLIMERAAGGELHQVLQEQRAKELYLPERWVALVIRQCLQAIMHVHAMGIIHKDLKSENILLLKEVDVNDPQMPPHAVIIDLGIGELFTARLGRRARCTVVAGTPTHMAPEVWRGNFGQVADVWSLGVVLFELLSGEIPFYCSSLNSAAEWVRLHRQGPNWAMLGHTSAQARAVCQRMLSCDERMRPTAQQCLGHAWFKAAETELPSEPAVRTAMNGTPVDERGNLESALADYKARSNFERVILLQVASQLHTSQVSRVGEIFMLTDADRSGQVSAQELVNGLKQLGVAQSDAEAYANCCDVDRNGRVDYTEFASACIGLLHESLRGLLWQSFCTLDVDGNGVLNRREVHQVLDRAELLAHGFPGDKASIDEVLNRLDHNGNGVISFDELCTHFLPARPPLPSPRTARGHAGATEAAEPSHDGPVPLPLRRAVPDEDFEHMLDEIEADHAASDGRVSPTSNTLFPDVECEGVSIATSPDFRSPSIHAGAAETGADLSGDAVLDADEELSRMLADIANSP
eukprot:gnl/TRDRNA2_/TRDRNA2_90647_c0_seq1.p1 gnl/TRDRNA2_/TRDRNA2_90647_c0~~gnl/TRDRNA2_/TRDRNA2_90647_c0_seq1.p1  ORF type:complete len:624 (+),score=109.14 gnl/TRDRNA2_/TRDRNA2_90647_c0_seq1:109-1980(+)